MSVLSLVHMVGKQWGCQKMSKQLNGRKTRTVERPRVAFKNIVFPKQLINWRTEADPQGHGEKLQRQLCPCCTVMGELPPSSLSYSWTSTLTCVMDKGMDAQAATTYLGLPLSPEASSSSEGGDATLGTDASSSDDGDVLGFGKHLSEIGHVCARTGKTRSCSGAHTLTLVLRTSRNSFYTHLPRLQFWNTNWFLSFCMLEFKEQFLEILKICVWASSVGQHVLNVIIVNAGKAEPLSKTPH